MGKKRAKPTPGGGGSAAAASKKSAKSARTVESPRQNSDGEDSEASAHNAHALSEESGDEAPKATPKAPKTPKDPMAESLHKTLLEALAVCKSKPYNKGTCVRLFCPPRSAAPSDTYPTPCPTLFPYSHAADDKAEYGAAEAEQHVS